MIASQAALHLGKFYGPWLLALAVSASAESDVPASVPLVLHFEGLEVPVLQAVLAIAGVLMARPLAPKGPRENGLPGQLLVTAIMLIVSLAWVIENSPGILFTFVVSIGLGFSGYSLIELAGEEVKGVIKGIFARVTEALNFKGPRDQ